jgi:hypothetical protein
MRGLELRASPRTADQELEVTPSDRETDRAAPVRSERPGSPGRSGVRVPTGLPANPLDFLGLSLLCIPVPTPTPAAVSVCVSLPATCFMKKPQTKVYIFIHNDGAMYETTLLRTSWRGGRPCRNADMKAKHEEEQMHTFFSLVLSLWLTAVGGKAISQSPHWESARHSRRPQPSIAFSSGFRPAGIRLPHRPFPGVECYARAAAAVVSRAARGRGTVREGRSIRRFITKTGRKRSKRGEYGQRE